MGFESVNPGLRHHNDSFLAKYGEWMERGEEFVQKLANRYRVL